MNGVTKGRFEVSRWPVGCLAFVKFCWVGEALFTVRLGENWSRGRDEISLLEMLPFLSPFPIWRSDEGRRRRKGLCVFLNELRRGVGGTARASTGGDVPGMKAVLFLRVQPKGGSPFFQSGY